MDLNFGDLSQRLCGIRSLGGVAARSEIVPAEASDPGAQWTEDAIRRWTDSRYKWPLPVTVPCHLDPRKLLMQGGILVLDPRILGLPSPQSPDLIYLKKKQEETLMKALEWSTITSTWCFFLIRCYIQSLISYNYRSKDCFFSYCIFNFFWDNSFWFFHLKIFICDWLWILLFWIFANIIICKF